MVIIRMVSKHDGKVQEVREINAQNASFASTKVSNWLEEMLANPAEGLKCPTEVNIEILDETNVAFTTDF